MSKRQTIAGTYASKKRWHGESPATSVRRVLKKHNRSMLITEVVKELQLDEPLKEWSISAVNIAVDWAQEKNLVPKGSKGNWNIRRYPGGKRIEFISNSGRNVRDKGDVGQIVRKMKSGSAPKTVLRAFAMHTAKKVEAVDFHGSIKNQGKWSESDVLVKFFRAPGSKEPYEIHNIEVEEKSKTKIKCQPQEVAQAFSAGENADRSWLMFHEDDWNDPKSHRQRKIEWLAGELGVGLISFRDSYESSTWKLLLKAKKRTPSAKRRNELINHERWGL